MQFWRCVKWYVVCKSCLHWGGRGKLLVVEDFYMHKGDNDKEKKRVTHTDHVQHVHNQMNRPLDAHISIFQSTLPFLSLGALRVLGPAQIHDFSPNLLFLLSCLVGSPCPKEHLHRSSRFNSLPFVAKSWTSTKPSKFAGTRKRAPVPQGLRNTEER